MTLSALTFRWHRWLGWLVGLQVVVWVVGGAVFSILPFQAWVKGGDAVATPALALPADWAVRTAPALQAAAAEGAVLSLAAVATPQGAALKLQLQGRAEPLLLPADGSAWRPPDEAAVRAFAQGFLRPPRQVVAIERIDEVPRRLLIVSETGGRRDVWRATTDDGLGTRLYFRGSTGEYLGARTEAWVWYDFFWRLHIMDYDGGDDFNGLLLRVAAVLALGLVVAGALLSLLAARRRWRRARR